MSRDPRRDECTICTAVAPEDVFTVRTYGDTPDTLKLWLVRRSPPTQTQTPKSPACAAATARTPSQVRSDVLGVDDDTSRDHDWGLRLTHLDGCALPVSARDGHALGQVEQRNHGNE